MYLKRWFEGMNFVYISQIFISLYLHFFIAQELVLRHETAHHWPTSVTTSDQLKEEEKPQEKFDENSTNPSRYCSNKTWMDYKTLEGTITPPPLDDQKCMGGTTTLHLLALPSTEI
jgi:hypothetical protein